MSLEPKASDAYFEDCRGPWIQLAYGGQFYLSDPRAEEVDIRDIANSLARINRFTGHAAFDQLSVAEHCVLLTDYVSAQGWSYEQQLEMLLHDAGEAYYGDDSWPKKEAVPALRDFYAPIDAVIREAFELPEKCSIKGWIKELDKQAANDDREKALRPLVGARTWSHEHLGTLGLPVEGWPVQTAERRFLRTFYAIQGGLGR